MKKFLFIYFFYQLIKITISLIPNWNFKNSTIDLLSDSSKEVEITILDKEMYNCHIILTKKISKNGDNITQQNYLKIDNFPKKETNWEDIESFYNLEGHYFICPKGKEYLYRYFPNEDKNPEIIGLDYIPDKEKDWELKCYYQPSQKWLFYAFTNSYKNNYIYGVKFDSNYEKKESFKQEAREEIFDFIWTTESKVKDGNQKYFMFGILLFNNFINLQKIYMTIEENKFSFDSNNNIKKALIEYKSNSYSYFKSKKNILYWITYNNINDIISGYTTKEINIEDEDISNLPIIINNNNPFQFLYNITINKLKLIRNTRFAYYEFVNNHENQIYHGILDISLNKIIFNTNETIKDFNPLNENSILAITNNSAYKICALVDKDKNCIDECDSNQKTIIDSTGFNYCGDSDIKCQLTLVPQNICISSCDQNIFILNEEKKECGLCKDLYSENMPYKLINNKGCLEHIPENSEPINEELKIYRCAEGYALNEGKYNCPNGTEFDKDKIYCIKINSSDSEGGNEQNGEENKKENKDYMLSIFIILSLIIIILILLLFCKRYFSLKKNDDSLIYGNDITELGDNSN